MGEEVLSKIHILVRHAEKHQYIHVASMAWGVAGSRWARPPARVNSRSLTLVVDVSALDDLREEGLHDF